MVGKIGMSTFTGKPGGSFISTNSRSLLKCLTGATTSNTSNSIALDNGKSWHFTIEAKNYLVSKTCSTLCY